MERKGKGAGGLRGRSPLARGFRGWNPLAGIRGSAPRTLPRALFARGIKHPVRHISRLRQYEVREILEHPLVLQGSIDDPQELPSQGDDRLSRPAPRLDLLVVPLQIRAVPLRDQRALHQRRAPGLLPRLVIRPERAVSLEFDTRGTIPKYAASFPSSAKSLMSPITDSKMLPVSGPIPLMLVRFLCPSSLRPSSAIVFSNSAMSI